MRYLAIILIFSLCIQGCNNPNKNSKTNANDKLNYKVKDNYFYISDKLIPSDCFAQLITELNGDNIQGTIYLDRNSFRGCLDANIKYPQNSIKNEFTYKINEQLSDNKYKITVFEKIDGSLRMSKNKIIIQFINKPYILANGETKMVLSLDKIGDW